MRARSEAKSRQEYALATARIGPAAAAAANGTIGAINSRLKENAEIAEWIENLFTL
jgi:hypothetical protein